MIELHLDYINCLYKHYRFIIFRVCLPFLNLESMVILELKDIHQSVWKADVKLKLQRSLTVFITRQNKHFQLL